MVENSVMRIIRAPERSLLVALSRFYLLFYVKQSDFEGTRNPFSSFESPHKHSAM